MANVKRNGSSATSKISAKEIPAPSGKENARPVERAIAVRRKLSFASCEAPRQGRVSLATKDEQGKETSTEAASERGRALFGQAFAAKTPFHVHCDEKNVGKPRVPKDVHRQQAAVRIRKVEGSGKVAQERSAVRSSIGIGGWRPCGQPRDCQQAQPSKIPRRSRCNSVPPQENGSGTATRRATSVEDTGRPQDRRRFGSSTGKGTKMGRPLAPWAANIRCKAIKGSYFRHSRLADAAIDALRKNKRTELPRNVSTPVDGAPPPSVPKIPLKAGLRAAAKSKTIEPDRAEAASTDATKETDPFRAEPLCRAEYNEDAAVVEFEREERSLRLSDRFLSEHINVEQRRLVVAYLIRIGTHCRYPSFVVYQSVKLFDVAMDRFRVETKFIQLTALACLWIELKRQENFYRIPSATKMVALSRKLYVEQEDLLIAYERMILCELNFNVTFADPYAVFAHHLINCGRCVNASEDKIAYLYKCGCYAIDVTLLDEQFCRTSVGLIAASTAELVLGLDFDTVATGPVNPRWLFWRGLLFGAVPGLPRRFQDEEIDRTRVAIFRRLLNSGKKHDGFEVVYKKYNRSRYGRVSDSFLKQVRGVAATEILFDP